MKSAIREFNTSGRCTVGKSLTFNGKDYPAGTTFPWRQLGVSVRKLRQLWDNRFIHFEPVKFQQKVTTAPGG